MNAPIRAVLFDCDGVLQRPANDWTGEISRLTGLEGDGLATFLDDISAAEQPVLDGSEPYAGPLGAVVARWGGALPQYRVGHRELVARLRADLAQQPGLALAGAALDGVGIAACLGSAATAATKIIEGSARAMGLEVVEG